LLTAAQSRVAGVRTDNSPTLEFEAEAAAWDRPSTTRDDLRVSLNFVVPLWQSGRVDARMAREQARFQELQAQLDQAATGAAPDPRRHLGRNPLLRESERRSSEANALYRDLAWKRRAPNTRWS